MSVRKAIGKMGSVARSGAKKAGNAVREGYGVARDHYPQVKNQVKGAYTKANELANRGLDYAVKVRDNASESSLLKIHEEYRRPKRRDHKHKRHGAGGQNVTVNVNVGGRKKRKRGPSRKSGFSLI